MQPDETDTTNSQASGRGTVTPPARDYQTQQNAVAQMTRDQIDQIYARQAAEEQAATQSQAAPPPLDHPQPTPIPSAQASAPQQITTSPNQSAAPGPYQRTHSDNQHDVNAAAWRRYHSSWQSYYQKYYERYYVGAVHQVGQRYQKQLATVNSQKAPDTPTPDDSKSLSKDEALYDLRSELLGKVKDSAKKVRKSRHFVPLISAVVVFIIFGFLQYNAIIFSYVQAYVSPGNINPQNIIVNPNTSLQVGPEPRLVIPKINVDVGVDYNTKPTNDTKVPGNLIDAMRKNVAYFGGFQGVDARPGQLGNFGLSGHSSNEWYTTGSQELKFVFVRLQDLQKGDIFYINYQGTRYTYTVSQVMTVNPDDAGKLNLGYDKPHATLITCVPIGTANSRLFVVGDQISPDPSTAKKPGDNGSGQGNAPQLTGKEPTVLERLFGAGSN